MSQKLRIREICHWLVGREKEGAQKSGACPCGENHHRQVFFVEI
jgi:hypothetical protein